MPVISWASAMDSVNDRIEWEDNKPTWKRRGICSSLHISWVSIYIVHTVEHLTLFHLYAAVQLMALGAPNGPRTGEVQGVRGAYGGRLQEVEREHHARDGRPCGSTRTNAILASCSPISLWVRSEPLFLARARLNWLLILNRSLQFSGSTGGVPEKVNSYETAEPC